MKIINKTKNAVLADKVIVADSFFKRLKGLLGRRDLKRGEALIINNCNSVHTMFMRFPIDIIFLDKDNRAFKVIKGLKPYRITGIFPASCYVVELPAGTLQESCTAPSDIIVFI